MKITVTRQDIQQGQRRDPEQCAVARALVRAGFEHSGVMGPSVMMPDRWGRLISLPLPAVVSDWIFDFDAGKPVRPITFEMDFDLTLKRANGMAPRQTGSSEQITLLSAEDLNSIARLRCGSGCKQPILSGSARRASKAGRRNSRELSLV